jgi:hypothetical protein
MQHHRFRSIRCPFPATCGCAGRTACSAGTPPTQRPQHGSWATATWLRVSSRNARTSPMASMNWFIGWPPWLRFPPFRFLDELGHMPFTLIPSLVSAAKDGGARQVSP